MILAQSITASNASPGAMFRFPPLRGIETRMRFADKLERGWAASGGCLCVGLDPDIARIPDDIAAGERPVLAFNKRVIDAVGDLVCAFKPQAAHHAAFGAETDLADTIAYIRASQPHAFIILDAKRGDIGSTAEMYAREAFDRYDADAVTVNPYMGDDTVTPFLQREDRGALVLCRTSNPDSMRFQGSAGDDGALFRQVAHRAQTVWNADRNVMLVVGATAPEELSEIRAIAPDLAFLIPGYGEQGGKAEDILPRGKRADGKGLVVSSSRAILWAGHNDSIRAAAKRARDELPIGG
jgi:orotidine-5'-phosphate decarboxylase